MEIRGNLKIIVEWEGNPGHSITFYFIRTWQSLDLLITIQGEGEKKNKNENIGSILRIKTKSNRISDG